MLLEPVKLVSFFKRVKSKTCHDCRGSRNNSVDNEACFDRRAVALTVRNKCIWHWKHDWPNY